MRHLLLYTVLALSPVSLAGNLTFQKVTDTASLSGADIVNSELVKNESGYSVRVYFSELGRGKLADVLDQDDTEINLVTGKRILLTVEMPRQMKPPEYFTISFETQAEAEELVKLLKAE